MRGNFDNPQFEPDREKPANFLNSKFRTGTPAYRVLKEIRAFPKPIVVDFNNVLANNSVPLVPNPDARAFLESLAEVGDIFIVTTAEVRWYDNFVKLMKNNDLWRENLVLMPFDSYKFITQHGYSEEGKHQVLEYLEMAKNLGWNFDERDFIRAPAYKTIAPIFAKPFSVPIIDDASVATYLNPGMLGILVEGFEAPYRTGGHLLRKRRKSKVINSALCKEGK